MVRPASGTTLERPDLNEVVYEVMRQAQEKDLMGLKLLPLFKSAKNNGQFSVIKKDQLSKIVDVRRGPEGNYNRRTTQFTKDNFVTEEYGIEELVDAVERSLYEDDIDADEAAVEACTLNILNAQEKRIATKLQNTTTFAGYTSALTHEWDDATNATPLADVLAIKAKIRTNFGKRQLPASRLKMQVSYSSFNDLLVCDEITSANSGLLTLATLGEEAQQDWLRKYFGMDDFIVGDGQYDSSKKKKDEVATMTGFWDPEYALIAVVSDSKRLSHPSLGRSILWTGDSPENIVVEQYGENQTRADVYRVRQNVQEKVFYPSAGWLLSNVTTI